MDFILKHTTWARARARKWMKETYTPAYKISNETMNMSVSIKYNTCTKQSIWSPHFRPAQTQNSSVNMFLIVGVCQQ